MTYNLETDRIIQEINNRNAKRVLIQLPDGLKTRAEQLIPEIESQTNANILIWFGSNFGACDLPIGVRTLNVDLVIAYGHNRYIKDIKGW